ncbi:hypothetical protein T07_14149 [Trichinella nelsoni]|uniref:Uncharacterized protein n=1 Tax=Trichinella nelsoni TaxID=6336 RepID=A0A0V0S0K0_9BILA|nr:hypothetical protein T07_14149 [Trichinella nelsoni]
MQSGHRCEKRCSASFASTLQPGYAPSLVVRMSSDRPVGLTEFRASSRGGPCCSRIFPRLAGSSMLRAYCWPICAGGNFHWPTVPAIGRLALRPSRWCHMTWQVIQMHFFQNLCDRVQCSVLVSFRVHP